MLSHYNLNRHSVLFRTIEDAAIEVLKSDSLVPYATTLREL